MAKNSKIEWTHHTFNPWWGCEKVSPACDNCYAETFAKRVGSHVWGRKAERRFFGEKHWAEPLKWNNDAQSEGERHRVFCASMADVFENRAELKPWRAKLWELIDQTPMLDWLLLTKRPEHVEKMVPWGTVSWPENIWLGTTVEDQKWANYRIPHLIKNGAHIRFLSCEPLLGKLSLRRWLKNGSINWVIAGGESGHNSRPMNPIWARSLRDQCLDYDVAFHFKQWGHWAPANVLTSEQRRTVSLEGGITMVAAGKGAAGRDLDGQVWDQVPILV